MQAALSAGAPAPGFFTLTELQERLNVSDRCKLRRNTVGRGAPFAVVGREVFFLVDSFAAWLKTIEQPGGTSPRLE
jgi:hypothetical protein